MIHKHCNSDIAYLLSNAIEYKINGINLEGHLIKIKELSNSLDVAYGRRSSPKKFNSNGLTFQYYYCKPINTLYIFTFPPYQYSDTVDLIAAKRDAVLITIFTAPQDFFTSKLGLYHLNNILVSHKYSWDNTGYFTTDCKKGNKKENRG